MQKVHRKLWVHRVRITDGELREGETVLTTVDPEWRIGARQAHSGTHVVHAALRQVLGPEALQAGSYNKPGYLRLDFAWNSRVVQLDPLRDRGGRQPGGTQATFRWPCTTPHCREARETGALALFGETYDETVRIVEIGGPWSIELCGGTHVEHSSQIGPVALIGESSVGSGLRRIEASVGIEAFRQLAAERALVAELSGMLKVPAAELPGRVEQLVDRLRVAEKELEKVRAAAVLSSAAALVDSATEVGGTAVVAATTPDGVPAADLRALATDVRGRFGDRPAVVALFGPNDGAVSFVVGVTTAAVADGIKAGDLVKAFLPAIDGRGGGRPDLAQGGGSRSAGIDDAIAAVLAAVAGIGSSAGASIG